MCGIFALYGKNFSKGSLIESYNGMSALLSHRGMDAYGVASIPYPKSSCIQNPLLRKKNDTSVLYFEHNLFENAAGYIGHHRLAITGNTDDASDQPFIDHKNSVIMSYNGEIYNYLELRSILVKKGYLFKTMGDTEVVLNAYLEWDTNCFEMFNGDFAILFYDHRKLSFIGARDRIGIKPMFYNMSDDHIVFSSEVKAFLGLPWFIPELNEYVAYKYLVADFPSKKTLDQSFLKNIFSLPPGSWFEFNLEHFKYTSNPYWVLSDEPCEGVYSYTNIDEAVEEFDFLLRDSVRIRLSSDKQLGAFLSGGIDSTSIAWQTKNIGKNIPSFSSIFPGSDYDESDSIDMVVQALDIKNTKHSINYETFIDEINDLVFIQDEPFSVLNVYCQYKNILNAKKAGVKILLDGGGADEYLSGYADYQIPAMADKISIDRCLEKNSELELFIKLSSGELTDWYNKNETSKRIVHYISKYYRKLFTGNEDALDRPFPENYKSRFRGSYLKYALKHSITDAWMNKSIIWANRYVDRSGMGCGIEIRVPFQDHRLIDFAFSLPSQFLFNYGYTKYILRKSMLGRLPKSIVLNKNKNGFEFPICELIANNNRFKDFFFTTASNDNFNIVQLVNKNKVIDELVSISNGYSNNYNIWRVFNLYFWMEQYIHRKAPHVLGK